MPKGLTPRQRMFVEAYRGNATEAAKAAGYSDRTAKQQGARLLTKADVRRALAAREAKVVAKHVKTRTELQEFWSSAMEGRKVVMRDRLRASELLAKSRGEFTQKIELRGELTLLELVNESMESKEAGHETAPGKAGGPAEVVIPPGEVASEPVSDRAGTKKTEES